MLFRSIYDRVYRTVNECHVAVCGGADLTLDIDCLHYPIDPTLKSYP